MKKIHLIGLVIILGIAALAVVAAMNMGEKSPILAAGTIEIDEALVPKADGIETLFIILHDADSQMPMPYGAVKEHLSPSERPAKGGTFYKFFITKEKIQSMMGMDAPPPQRWRLKVRLDRDGMGGADQTGDLVGQVQDVPLGSDNVVVKIDSVVP